MGAVSARVIAAAGDYGAFERSDRVNTRRESSWLVTGILMFVVAIGFTVVMIVVGAPVVGLVIWAIFALFMLVIGFVMTVRGVQLAHRGKLVVHRYADGFVVERERGNIRAARYDEMGAALRSYAEPGDSTSSPIDHVVVQLHYPDGLVLGMAETLANAEPVLALGRRCGAGDPEPIEYRAAVQFLAEHEWA